MAEGMMERRDLAQLMIELIEAIERKDTEQDGNWGWPSFSEEMERIKKELSALKQEEEKA